MSDIRNNNLRDRDWVKRSFMLTVDSNNPEKGTSKSREQTWLYYTEADFNFTNTSVGGNFTINSLPQYTIFADIPAGGIKSVQHNRTADPSMIGGMGRFYYESIQAWSQKVSFRFGVPEYKGLLTFFTTFYDGGAAILGRTGRMGKGLFYLGAKVVGNLIALPWTVFVFVADAVRWMANRPSTRYYNVKPAMALYWQRVNLIANMLAANMGLTSRNHRTSKVDSKKEEILNAMDVYDANTNAAMGSYSWEAVSKVYNNLFMKQGGIDAYWVANRLNRAHHEYRLQMSQKGLGTNDFMASVKREISAFWGSYRDKTSPGSGIDDYLKKYHESRLGLRMFDKGDGSAPYDVLSTDPLNFYMNEKLADTDPLKGATELNALGEISTGNATQTSQAATTTANAAANNTNIAAVAGIIGPAGKKASTTNNSTTPNTGNTTGTGTGTNTGGATTGNTTNTGGTGTNTTTTPATGNGTTTGTKTGTQVATANGSTTTAPATDASANDAAATADPNAPQNKDEELEYNSGRLLTEDSADDNFIYSMFKEKEGAEQNPENPVLEWVKGWGEGFVTYSKDVAKGGAEWVNFRVDAVKTVTETFNSQTAPSELQSRINGASSLASEMRFSLSDLNTGFAPLDSIVGGIRNMFLGLGDGLHLSGLAVLMGSGYIDMPERWTDSNVQLPSLTYTIKCRPPYGNVLSRYLNMHFVIACLLAGALPISYGRHAYGAPFLCEFYMQGKAQSRLAIIDSLSITRGEGNLGWSEDGDFLGCDITFTVKDLSSVMHAPIDSGMDTVVSLRWLISDDNIFNDYMAVLSNLSVAEMTYSWEKLKRNFATWKVTHQNFLSPSRMAVAVGDTMIGRAVRKLTPAYNLSIQ